MCTCMYIRYQQVIFGLHVLGTASSLNSGQTKTERLLYETRLKQRCMTRVTLWGMVVFYKDCHCKQKMFAGFVRTCDTLQQGFSTGFGTDAIYRINIDTF